MLVYNCKSLYEGDTVLIYIPTFVRSEKDKEPEQETISEAVAPGPAEQPSPLRGGIGNSLGQINLFCCLVYLLFSLWLFDVYAFGCCALSFSFLIFRVFENDTLSK